MYGDTGAGEEEPACVALISEFAGVEGTLPVRGERMECVWIGGELIMLSCVLMCIFACNGGGPTMIPL